MWKRRKKSPRSEEDVVPFKARVEAFWAWFAENEERLYEELQRREIDPEALSERITSAASIAWELCPSPEEGREGLALSAEGSDSKRILVGAMLAAAPPLKRWTLFGSKQPSDEIAGASVRLGDGQSFDFSDFWLAVDFDPESQRLEIQVHHPKFSVVPPDGRSQLTFIALDNALGENLVEAWVGPIEHTPDRTPDQKYGIVELRRQARAALELHDLDPDADPADMWMGYRSEEQGDGDLVARDDIIAGSTQTMGPTRGLTDPEYDDELGDSGACFAYVMMARECLEQGREVEQRGELEDHLGRALKEVGSGDCIGGALGTQYAYIDLVFFDEQDAIDRVRRALSEVDFVERASLRFFASNRRDEHIALLTSD